MDAENRRNWRASSGDKAAQNAQPPPATATKPAKKAKKPVSTTEKQSMAYVTVKSIENETSYLESDWTLFVLKELIDNAWDWLNDEYPIIDGNSKTSRKIEVRIWLTHEGERDYRGVQDRFLHIAVTNSNVRNLAVFDRLDKTFDFSLWHSTKRNQHRMTCGSLGDALKRSLGMGYASWTKDYDARESFEDKQWEQPVIVRCKGKEFRAYIIVDSAKQERWTQITEQKKASRDIGTDTEVEITLPILNALDDDDWLLQRLENYYSKAKIGKSTRTEFSIQIGQEQQQQDQGVKVE